MTVITNIEDLRVLAQKRVPRMFYDYVDTGSWTEGTYRSNVSDFAAIKLRQRVAINMENRNTRSTMVGQDVAMPVALKKSSYCRSRRARASVLSPLGAMQ